MESLVQFLNKWEIQLLVLLSFTLQMFLFFTGGHRRRSTNTLLRFSMWIAYLGADLVAVYALGFLSRHKDITTGNGDTLRAAHPLAFLWAPFLLMHLGGQDTITAFAIEDNNLWLRHLLNLVIQVVLALYVFWESMERHNMQVLVSGVFVFIAGIIKYGERTLALMYGDFKIISNSIGDSKNISNSIGDSKNISNSIGNKNDEDLSKLMNRDGYFGIVCFALRSAPGIRWLFAGRTLHQMESHHRELLTSWFESNLIREKVLVDRLSKLLEMELDLMYDDMYTKARVLRTRSGIILRCVSQVSLVAAFVLFIVNSKHRYNRADLAITYMLFTGGLCLEVCAVLILLMSPWTWAWLDARECRGIARISKFLLSSNIGRPERRPLWSNRMGQYKFLSYMGCEQSRLSKLVKTVTRKMASVVSVGKGKPLLWMSKSLDTRYLEVDKEIMDHVVWMIYRYRSDGSTLNAQYWPNLGPLLEKLFPDFGASFGYGIVRFHILTEVHLRNYNDSGDEMLVSACRKLSNYMLHLLVTQPEMLPVSGTTEPILEYFHDRIVSLMLEELGLSETIQCLLMLDRIGTSFIERIGASFIDRIGASFIDRIGASKMLECFGLSEPSQGSETLKEIRDLWTWILIYSAGKSRAEMLAAQLSRGGELLTFAWLLMAHNKLGLAGEDIRSSGLKPIRTFGQESSVPIVIETLP